MATAEELITAVKSNDLQTLRDLLREQPGLASARDGAGVSAVLLARYRSHVEALRLLLEAAPSLDVFEAAASANESRVAELLDTDPGLATARSADGFTALQLAAFFGCIACARALIAAGADVNAASDNHMRVQALHSAAAARDFGLCALLLEHGADVDARQHGGFTPLHAAAQHGDDRLAALLLVQGADPALATDGGQDAASLASASGNDELAARLRGPPAKRG